MSKKYQNQSTNNIIRGFTLIELLAVVALLGLISVLVAPTVINQLTKNKEKTSGAISQIMNSAVDLYLDSHSSKYSKTEGDIYCVQIKALINEGFLVEPVLDPVTNEEYSDELYIKVDVGNSLDFDYSVTSTCTELIK